jgi:hypothetical protein
MSYNDVAALAEMPSRDQIRVRAANQPRTTVLQDRTSKIGHHFTFCDDTLYGISIDLKGGMNKFAQLVEIEARTAGRPDVRISRHELMSLIVARWTSGAEQMELILQENFGDAESISIGKSFEDSRYECK